jgi:hypothetical protein
MMAVLMRIFVRSLLLATATLLLGTSAFAEVIECPNGQAYVVEEPQQAPCVELCPGGEEWIVSGLEECPTEAPSDTGEQELALILSVFLICAGWGP